MLVNKFRELIKENFESLQTTIREVIEKNCENTAILNGNSVRVYIDINGNISTTGVMKDNSYLDNEVGENPTMLEVFGFNLSDYFITEDDMPIIDYWLDVKEMENFKEYISQCEGIDMDDISMDDYINWEYYKDFNSENFEQIYNEVKEENIDRIMAEIKDESYFEIVLRDLKNNLEIYEN